MDAITGLVSAHGGVVRTMTLRAEGHSAHGVARALEAGALVRVRRGWVATPDADSGLETIFRVHLRWLWLPIRSQIWIAERIMQAVARGLHRA